MSTETVGGLKAATSVAEQVDFLNEPYSAVQFV